MDQLNLIIEGIHYASRRVVRIGIRNGFIYSLGDIDDIYWTDEGRREQLPLIAPGLIDLQLNGFMGVDFNDPELGGAQVEAILPLLLRLGVTMFYPALVTGPKKKTFRLLQTLGELIEGGGPVSRMIGGIHLEGPFISGEDGPRGAHMKRYCLEPDIGLLHRWQEQAQGHIRIVTLAPELPGSGEFIRECVRMGIRAAIGHTAASREDIERAAEAGATLSTHLGNGAHPLLPRHPNYIWDQLAEDRLYASMIADGFHLPDSVLKVFVRTKGEKAILVSDAMPFAGQEPGLYESPATGKVRLTKEGRLHREGNPGLLAGSAATLLEGVGRMSRMEGLTFAWNMASLHPASLIDLPLRYGLHVGMPADLVLLQPGTGTPVIRKTYKNGVEVTGGA